MGFFTEAFSCVNIDLVILYNFCSGFSRISDVFPFLNPDGKKGYLRTDRESVHRGNICICMRCDKQNVLVKLVAIYLTWKKVCEDIMNLF